MMRLVKPYHMLQRVDKPSHSLSGLRVGAHESRKERRLIAQASCLDAAVITSCESPMLVFPRLQRFRVTLKG
ncbi:hypothetical protein BTA30_08555 [Bacillus swezeyi]|uniref:Uncharacterized protein n=1 Tax=Bacillus swezeyi TaxID=1925020 RepID=A0A1R1QII8_9BACI|nr:hypothetical protein BW143_14355 [Bacillus swezeyi]OMI31636.1 hypothetical protein BTA30_08555 [Bacillus swezeyi]